MPFVWIDNGMRIIPENVPTLKTPKIVAMENQKITSQTHSGLSSFAGRLAHRTYNEAQHPIAERHKIILAQEIMSSPVITLPPRTTLAGAWSLIRDHRFRHIPIVGPEGIPLGILSDRTLLRAAVTLGRDITSNDDPNDPSQTIGNLIAAPVLTALPHAEIHQIAKTLFEQRIGAMPIIDEQNRLIGIITRSDILRALVHLGPMDLWG